MAIPVDRVGDEREYLLFGRQVACCGCRWIVCESDRCYETGDDECARVDCCCRDILTSCRIALASTQTVSTFSGLISLRRDGRQPVYWRCIGGRALLAVEGLRLSHGRWHFRVTRLERTTDAGVPSLCEISQSSGPQDAAPFTSPFVLAREATSSLRSYPNTSVRLWEVRTRHFAAAGACLGPLQRD